MLFGQNSTGTRDFLTDKPLGHSEEGFNTFYFSNSKNRSNVVDPETSTPEKKTSSLMENEQSTANALAFGSDAQKSSSFMDKNNSTLSKRTNDKSTLTDRKADKSLLQKASNFLSQLVNKNPDKKSNVIPETSVQSFLTQPKESRKSALANSNEEKNNLRTENLAQNSLTQTSQSKNFPWVLTSSFGLLLRPTERADRSNLKAGNTNKHSGPSEPKINNLKKQSNNLTGQARGSKKQSLTGCFSLPKIE